LQSGAGIAAEVDIMARRYWFGGAALFLLGMLFMASGGQETSGLLDYRAWLLTALGVLAVVIGNFYETPNRKQ
jgi:hypothetical protein